MRVRAVFRCSFRGGVFELSADELELRVKSQGGYAVSRDGAEVVALDLARSEDLRRRGFVRDVVRQVQDLRKNSGLDVADRIVLNLTGLDDLVERLRAPSRARSLALEVIVGAPAPARAARWRLDDGRAALAWIKKV